MSLLKTSFFFLSLVIEKSFSEALEDGDVDVITFSEYPINTAITDQYIEQGVLFDGNGELFITTDGANPTSPVLSGTPMFTGEIGGSFVARNTRNPTTVLSFEFDAGFFDAVGSTRLTWYDPDGTKLGQSANKQNGIERMVALGGNIASFTIGIFEEEPAGFAIDNVRSYRSSSGVLFREKSGDGKDGSWGFLDDEIPGFDHVGFNFMGDVYESHPGYGFETYQTADGSETVKSNGERGVFQVHSRDTFAHYSTTFATKVVEFVELPISDHDAVLIQAQIIMRLGSAFGSIDFGTLEGIQRTLTPEAQKGRQGNSFTCVGLVEWAAEEAGLHGGAGFIPNALESIGDKFPLLSPQLLFKAMRIRAAFGDVVDYLKGFFDPIDYILTDPLGRRVGVVGDTNFAEVPFAFASPNGNLEYLVIANPVPGPWKVEVIGIAGEIGNAVIEAPGGSVVEVESDGSETMQERFLNVPVTVGGRGDVNGDGIVDQADLTALANLVPMFTNGFGHPGDLNADGALQMDDVELMDRLLLSGTPPAPTSAPTTAKMGKKGKEQSKKKSKKQKKEGRK